MIIKYITIIDLHFTQKSASNADEMGLGSGLVGEKWNVEVANEEKESPTNPQPSIFPRFAVAGGRGPDL